MMVLDADGAIVQDKDFGADDIIELRLKPQKTTFNFPNDDIRQLQAHNEKDSMSQECKSEKKGSEIGINQDQPISKEDAINQKKRKATNSGGSCGFKLKEKPPSVSTIDVEELLERIRRKDMMNMTGLESMSILSWFLEKMIWITELIDNEKISELEISELLFGELLWKNIVDKEFDIDNDEVDRVILDELRNRKDKYNNRRKLEMISKSQEELGVSLRKSSMILSNFEDNDITETDLEKFVHEEIGSYEKCCTNIENLNFIHKKFYLKVEPKIGLINYIDRINANLDISAAVGLCTGWFLFKFLFNLRCDEYLSDGSKFNNNDNNDDIKLSMRSLPLSLGSSFEETNSSFSSISDSNSEVSDEINVMSQGMNLDDSSTSIISNTDNDSSDKFYKDDKFNSFKKVSVAEVNKRNAFRLLLSSIRIASKLIEDKNFKQGYYCKVTGLQKVEDLFRLELALGYGLDWELFANEHTLWRYLLHMKCLRNAVEIIEERISHENI